MRRTWVYYALKNRRTFSCNLKMRRVVVRRLDEVLTRHDVGRAWRRRAASARARAAQAWVGGAVWRRTYTALTPGSIRLRNWSAHCAASLHPGAAQIAHIRPLILQTTEPEMFSSI